MTETEYLLTCLIEELAETSQEVCKCLRFTTDHRSPHDNVRNIDRAGTELSHVVALLDMLEMRGVSVKINPAAVQDKIRRTQSSIDLSKKMGVIK